MTETDRQEIRALIDAWPVWRDGGDWVRLAAAWHSGGTMAGTRFAGSADDFVAQTRAGYERGAEVRHAQSGFWCDVRGDRAVSVTGMAIHQRAHVHGVEVDATCLGRFVDMLERREGRWAIVRRQPVYDRDRLDPVRPGTALELDEALLASFPPAYRHLAYLQHQQGLTINRDLPAARGSAYDALMAECDAWLAAGEAGGSGPRRVVIGDGERGSTVALDVEVAESRQPVPGLTTHLIWASAAPADYRLGEAEFPRPAGIAPPIGGSRFSVVELAPGHRSAALHRTDTLDYVICLAGPVEMLLEEGGVTLGAGDIAVQRGTNHGWHNPGPHIARVAVVLLDAGPKRDGSVHGAAEAP